MSLKKTSKLVLAIETSIKNGSLSLLDDGREVNGWTGHDGISRSEDLLPQIEQLLVRNSISLKNIELIAVSLGPGSFTGLRVGIATAKALASAIGCQIVGVSILEALAAFDSSSKGEIMTVVSAGRGQFFWQKFQKNNNSFSSEIKTGSGEILQSDYDFHQVSEILIEPVAYRDYQQIASEQRLNIRLVKENFARVIGLSALAIPEKNKREILPLYIRPAVAAK